MARRIAFALADVAAIKPVVGVADHEGAREDHLPFLVTQAVSIL